MCLSVVSSKNLNPIRTVHARASQIVLTVMLAFAIAGCSARSPEPEPIATQTYYPPPVVQPVPHRATQQKGAVATWYGSNYAGKRTSTGEKFDPNALTAASKTLPLGSRVRVTNPDNGKSVVVRINDRLPHGHRKIDLSRRAAEELGITKKGVAHVKVAPVTGGADENATSKSSSAAVTEAEETHHSRHRSKSKSHQQPSEETLEKVEVE